MHDIKTESDYYDGIVPGRTYAVSDGGIVQYINIKCNFHGTRCVETCRLFKNGKCQYQESLHGDMYRQIDNVISDHDSAKNETERFTHVFVGLSTLSSKSSPSLSDKKVCEKEERRSFLKESGDSFASNPVPLNSPIKSSEINHQNKCIPLAEGKSPDALIPLVPQPESSSSIPDEGQRKMLDGNVLHPNPPLPLSLFQIEEEEINLDIDPYSPFASSIPHPLVERPVEKQVRDDGDERHPHSSLPSSSLKELIENRRKRT